MCIQHKVNIREQIALDLSADSQTGAFTIDVYAADGTHLDHIGGNIVGQRFIVDTVDTSLP